MADRRMFHKGFMMFELLNDLSDGALKLYLYLNLQADDDGFIGSPKPVMNMCRCKPKHLQELVEGGYVIQFDSGVLVITHWRVHNQIRKDRYKPTRYTGEWKTLTMTETGMYVTGGDPLVANLETQDRLGKDRLGEDRLGEDRLDEERIEKERKEENRIDKDRIEKDKTVEPSPPPAGEESSSSSTHQSVYIYFEKSVLDIYQQCCPSLQKVEHISRELQENIRKLRDHGWSLSAIEKAFRLAEASPYLKGGGKDGWIAGLAWLCKEENLQKVADGAYRAFERAAPKKTIYGCSDMGQAELEAIQKLLTEP